MIFNHPLFTVAVRHLNHQMMATPSQKWHKTFIPSWCKDFPWLEYDKSIGMICSVWKTAKKMNIFTKGCTAALAAKKPAGLLALSFKKQEAIATDEVIPQLRTMHYLMKKNEAVSHFPDLMLLQKQNGAPISSYYKHHEAYGEMLVSLNKTVKALTLLYSRRWCCYSVQLLRGNWTFSLLGI